MEPPHPAGPPPDPPKEFIDHDEYDKAIELYSGDSTNFINKWNLIKSLDPAVQGADTISLFLQNFKDNGNIAESMKKKGLEEITAKEEDTRFVATFIILREGAGRLWKWD